MLLKRQKKIKVLYVEGKVPRTIETFGRHGTLGIGRYGICGTTLGSHLILW